MFNLAEFDVQYLGLWFFLIYAFLFTIFRSRTSGLYDPLNYHFVWLSSVFSVVLHSVIFEGSVYSYVALISMSFYILLIWILLKGIDLTGKNYVYCYSNFHLIIVLLVWVLSKYSAFLYIFTNPPDTWVLYLYEILQGRGVLQRIVEVGIQPVLLFVLFNVIIFNERKAFAIFSLAFFVFFNSLLGGKATFLNVIVYFLFFAFFYKRYFEHRIVKFYPIIILVIVSSVVSMLFVFMLLFDLSFISAVNKFANRVFANGDGFHYYVKYQAWDKLDAGFLAFLKSIFGVYLKGPLGFDYKNVGWQLSEIASSRRLDFAQGANYNITLQVYIMGLLGSVVAPIILAISVFIFRKLLFYRSLHIYTFSISVLMFNFVVDFEYALFSFVAITVMVIFVSAIFWALNVKHSYRIL
ncbi:O-antigen polymerase [Vibrio astriarenae]